MPELERSSGDGYLGLLAVFGRVEAHVNRRLRTHGLGLSEYRVLRLLRRSDKNEMRLLDLTDALQMEQSSVSRLVTRLERDGFVKREPCGDDRRGVFCVLTPTAKELERRLSTVFGRALAEALHECHKVERDTAAVDALEEAMRQLRR